MAISSSDFVFNESQIGKLAKNIDWKTHKLGPVEQWPQSLQLTVSLILDSQFPMFIAWGKDRVFLYNDAYAPILGEKHPHAFGRTFYENWNEIWDDISPLIQKVDQGEALFLEDLKLMMHRHRPGQLEETYFTFSYSPIRSLEGKVEGLYCACVETTDKVQRRKQLEESETRFKLASEATRDAIWDWDLLTNDVAWNEAIHNEYGYPREAMKSDVKWWTEHIHPDDRDRVLESIHKVIDDKNGKHWSDEYRYLKADGTYITVNDRGIVERDEDGAAVRMIGAMENTTEKNDSLEFKEQLRYQSQLTQTITDNAASCLFMMDKKGHPTFMNPAAMKETGYDSIDEIKDKPLHYAVHWKKPDGSYYPMEECPVDNAQADLKAVQNQEEIFCRKDGTLFPVSYSIAPLEKDGEVVGSVLEFRDITERKQQEQALRQAKEEAEKANQLKSAFLANMSHEIRTPLGAMMGFADLLRDPGLSRTERLNYLDILARNGEQLSVIINDILDLSKVEAGHLALEYTEVQSDQIAAEVISLLRIKAKEKDLVLEYSSEEGSEKIVTDPIRVRQILINLVSNAIKFTHYGSVKIKSYYCKNEVGNKSLCFEIADTGIGLTEEQKKKIFKVFVQADDSMTRRFGGTGLGLALSKKLAQELGGDITITRSKPYKGSVFLLNVEDRPEKFKNNLEDERLADEVPQKLHDQMLTGVKVLVVDDAPDNQRLIWLYLTKYGATVESAENGLMGYRKAIKGDHDIVIMDIQMPEMDGYSATEKLRAAGYTKPIVALTAHAMDQVRLKCLNVGCSDHLSKPLDPEKLISTIARHIHD